MVAFAVPVVHKNTLLPNIYHAKWLKLRTDEFDTSQSTDSSLKIEAAKWLGGKNEIKHQKLANIRMKQAVHTKRLKTETGVNSHYHSKNCSHHHATDLKQCASHIFLAGSPLNYFFQRTEWVVIFCM